MFFVGTALLEQDALVTAVLLGIKMMVKLKKYYDEEKEEKQLQYYKNLSTTFAEK